MSQDLNQRNRRGWERVARAYAGDAPEEDDPDLRARLRERFCQRLRGDRVLEVGCGPGTDAAALAARGLRVTASDYSEAFLAVVRERYPDLPTHRMDMTRPDLPPGSFDGVLGLASFLHLPRALAAPTLAGLRRLLAPGGLLGLWLIGSTQGVREYTIDAWAGDPECSMLFTCYERPEIARLLEEAGCVEVELVDDPPSPAYAELPRLVERGIESYQVFARAPQDPPAQGHRPDGAVRRMLAREAGAHVHPQGHP